MSGAAMGGDLFIIRHKRTGMFVSENNVSSRHSYGRMGHLARWKFVRSEADATRFAEDMVIHPIIQLDLEGKCDVLPADPASVRQAGVL